MNDIGLNFYAALLPIPGNKENSHPHDKSKDGDESEVEFAALIGM